MTKTPWGPLGYITYKRTYSRRLKENDTNSKTEEFTDTIDRIINACEKQLKCGFTEEENERLREYFLSLKGSVAGRFLWQLGTKTVDRLGLASLQNCCAVVVDHPVRPFVWAMDMLMLGSGVGYNIQKENVYQIPAIKSNKVKVTRLDTNDADFIVPDSREGWCELLKRTLEAFFNTGKSFTYSTVCIRGKGAPIKGFGGVASGPEELCWGIDQISQVLEKRRGKKMRPIDALDVMNIIGYVVVAGNVRRSAQIAIGDMDDIQFLTAKNWNLGNIPNWRAMSNNSVVCNDMSKLPGQFWEGYLGNGEPYGLVNLKLARSIGRTGETQYPDKNVMISNPCQPEFATFLTKEGVKLFKDISIGSEIWSKEGWTTVKNKWSTGIKPVYSIKTTGGEFIGTLNHRVDTKNGKVEVKDAEEILTIAGPVLLTNNFDSQIVLDGIFFGDGYHKKNVGRDYTYPVLIIGKNDQDYYSSEISSYLCHKFQDKGPDCSEYRVNTTITADEKEKTFNLSVPDRYYLKDAAATCSFLRGLYTANGSVIQCGNTSVRITFKTASSILSRQIQQMLSSVGIRSYITTNKPQSVDFANGTYVCKKSYDINITKDFGIFYKYIGFLQEYKMQKIKNVIDSAKPSNRDTYTSVIGSEYLGDFEVFDITVDNESHTYWTGGLSVSNCSEQFLESFESCCLSEIFLPNISSKEELKDIATLLYRICKHSLALPCHHEETESVVHKNMRMGIGMTGLLQATDEQWSWLDETYTHLRQFDVEYSAKNKFPISVKITTVKPSGTLSLLPNVTPGIHPGFSKYFIRRIRIAANSPLIELCKEHGYQVECQKNFDGSDDRNTMVVSFPCKFSDNTIVAEEMTAIKQLEYVKKIQQLWSDNAVSCTVYYKKEELEEIKQWLLVNYNNNLKAVSFLLHSEHGFVQAPYEEITRDQFNMMSFATRLITSGDIKDELDTSGECVSGACPVR